MNLASVTGSALGRVVLALWLQLGTAPAPVLGYNEICFFTH